MLGVYTPSGELAPQLMRQYDANCMGNYYLARDGKWMWDPNCVYRGTGPISGADLFGLTPDGQPAGWSTFWKWVWGLASVAGAATGAYHGYKRHHESVGWAVGWSLLGGLFPLITIPLEFAEGFGKPMRSKETT